MAGNWRHIPGKHGVPKVGTPKAKKPKAPKPYNPLTGSMHSLEYLQSQAQGQAAADTNAQLAALPSVKDVQGGAQALAALLSANQARQASLASSASPAFGAAFKTASAPSAAASIGAGGQAPQINTGAQGLVGAMGANLAGALGSGINAATLEGQRQVGSLLGQRKAVAAGKQSLYDKYLAQAKQDALQNAQIRLNNALSAQGLGIKLQDVQNQADYNTARIQESAANRQSRSQIARANRREKAREANQNAQLTEQKILASLDAATRAAKKSALDRAAAMAEKFTTPVWDGTYEVDAHGNATGVKHYAPQYSYAKAYRRISAYLRANGFSPGQSRLYASEWLQYDALYPSKNPKP